MKILFAVVALESSRHIEKTETEGRTAGPKTWPKAPPSIQPRMGHPRQKRRQYLYCEVNACHAIMPRNGANATNGKCGDGERLGHPPGPSISASSGWITPATGGSASQSTTPTSSQSDSSNSSSPGAGQTAQGNPYGQLYALQESPTDPNGDNMSTISGSVTVLSNDLPASSYISGLTQFDTGLNLTCPPFLVQS